MMKRAIVLLLLALLLCGCAQEQPGETTLPPQTQPAEYVEPIGIYDPESAIEELTDGAIRCYRLDMELAYHMEMMGDSLLVFSGSEGTTLTCLSGENLYIRGQVELPFWLRGGASTQVTEKGVSFLDPETREMVFLDTSLKEVKRFAAPENLTGDPMLSEDRQLLYYCTGESVRVLDLETGISRLLKQISYPTQTLEGLLLDGQILLCGVADQTGSWELLFIDTGTGQTLTRTRENVTVTSGEAGWYASVTEGAVRSLVFGSGEDASQLIPSDISASGWYLPRLHGAVTASGTQNVTLEYYDLSSGLRTAALEAEGITGPWCVSANEAGTVWMLTSDAQTGKPVIHRWETAKSAVSDETVYTGVRYTEKNPDLEALENCRDAARRLGDRFGVDILVGADATDVQPWDFTLETEYSAPVVQRYLQELETVLSWYPEDYFTKAMAATESGRLKICIVRSLTGTPESGSLATALGLQFWVEGEAYLAVAPGEAFQRTLCHELFHAAETLVFSKSNLLDDWDWLNPEGFEYDLDFIANETRDGSAYLQESTRAFIDTYSMSFPREDRARIMEYAMMEGCESYFGSEIMQNKLRTLCQAIREAFGWEKSEETFRWEQYLKESLAYQKKK